MSIQIPNLHTSNKTMVDVREGATVFIKRQNILGQPGTFKVTGTLQFNPATEDYPSGNLKIDVRLGDSESLIYKVTTVEQLDTTGRVTPTAYASGRCTADSKRKGLRYWIMLADNKRLDEKETADVISFLIFDRTGKRVAYGTGPVARGDVVIAPTQE